MTTFPFTWVTMLFVTKKKEFDEGSSNDVYQETHKLILEIMERQVHDLRLGPIYPSRLLWNLRVVELCSEDAIDGLRNVTIYYCFILTLRIVNFIYGMKNDKDGFQFRFIKRNKKVAKIRVELHLMENTMLNLHKYKTCTTILLKLIHVNVIGLCLVALPNDLSMLLIILQI